MCIHWLIIHRLIIDATIYLQRGMFGMYHRLPSILVHRNTLREGKSKTMLVIMLVKSNISFSCVYFCKILLKMCFLIFHSVHSKGVQVYCPTERTNLQSKGASNNGSNVSGFTCNRNINTRSSGKNLTATFAFNWRIFYVNFRFTKKQNDKMI